MAGTKLRTQIQTRKANKTMKHPKLNPILLAATALSMAVVLPALSQAPGAPDTNGLSPTTFTIYINGTNSVNNNGSDSIGMAMAKNGNVIVGWEDDDTAPVQDIESVWTIFDSSGRWITPNTKIDC